MTEEQPIRTIDINELHAINERFNAFLAKKARLEGRIHDKFQKLIDVDCLEWAAKARAGLLAESQLPSKLPVKEEDCPISERTGKRKLAVWDPIRHRVTGYASEDEEEDGVSDPSQPPPLLPETPQEEDPEQACPISGSADSPQHSSDSEISDPSDTARD